MESTEFFGEYGNQWKRVTGLYCIEQPLFSKVLKKGIYKVGFCRHSLHTRLADYRTAYGVMPFKIHCLIQIPMGVFGRKEEDNSRVAFTLLNEQRLLAELRHLGLSAGANEWFFDLRTILDVMKALYDELMRRYPNVGPHWKTYFPEKRLRRRTLKTKESDIHSRLFDDVKVIDRSHLRRD